MPQTPKSIRTLFQKVSFGYIGAQKAEAPMQYATSPEILADLELVERFSHHWQENADSYLSARNELSAAAKRLLESVEQGRSNLDSSILARLDRLSDDIPCLARQPLFYPEMFHGVKISRDGSVSNLSNEDRIHVRASGLLSGPDRSAITEMYQRIVQGATSPVRVAEIGSAVGGGSTRIAGRFVKQNGGVLYCVDPWQGFWYHAFLANVQIYGFEKTVIPVRGFSEAAADLFNDGSLDAAFIDGSHLYKNVAADIEAYLPKIKKGGWLFGHDLHDLPSRFDRDELLKVSNVNNTVVNYKAASGTIEQADVHPGVILAVQDKFGDDVEIFPGSVVWAKQI
jgi:predicted O-methyltransferase YrrM